MMRYLKYIILLLIFPFYTIHGNAQDYIPEDSLKNKSFSELKDSFYSKLETAKKDAAKQIANFKINKAKKEHNIEVIANSYILLHFIANNMTNATKYIDSAISISKTNNLDKILHESYIHKGVLNSLKGQPEQALSYYIKARDFFKDQKGEFYNKTQHYIASFKLHIGAYREAADIFKENSMFDYETSQYNDPNCTKLTALYTLGLAYIGLKKHDSATIVFNEGAQLSSIKNYGYYTPTMFRKEEAGNQFALGNYKVAKDSIVKVIPYFVKRNLNPDLAECYFYLGKINNHNRNFKKATDYYKKLDSLYKISGYLIPEFRDAYKGILDYYKTKGDTEKELYYTNRLLTIDSIINKEFRLLVQKLHKDYDTKNLIAQKDRLLKKQRNNSVIYYVIFSILLIIAVIGFVFNFYNRKKDQKKFLKLVHSNHRVKPKISSQSFKNDSLEINDEIIRRILGELTNFETKKGFLNKKITLSTLSKKLKTNPKYLSKIINTHKHKTFRNYVNDLRINYILDCLKNDSKFKKYTVKAISEEAGFSNPESFTKAFKKQTELTVSYFLKKMNQSA